MQGMKHERIPLHALRVRLFEAMPGVDDGGVVLKLVRRIACSEHPNCHTKAVHDVAQLMSKLPKSMRVISVDCGRTLPHATANSSVQV